MSEEASQIETLASAEIATKLAEREKFLAEAHELKRPLISRPGFWGALIPGGAAVFTAYIAVTSDVFEAADDRASARLERANAAADLAQSQKTLFDAETLEAKLAREKAQAELEEAQLEFKNAQEEFGARTKLLETEFGEREAQLRQQESGLETRIANLEAREESLVEREKELTASIRELELEVVDAPLKAAITSFATEESRNAREELFEVVSLQFDAHPDSEQSRQILSAAAEEFSNDFGVWSRLVVLPQEDGIDRRTYDALIEGSAALVGQPGLSGFDFLELGFLSFSESVEEVAQRCRILKGLLETEGIMNADELLSHFGSCVNASVSSEFPEGLLGSLAASIFQDVATQVEAENEDYGILDVIRAAKTVGFAIPQVGDLLIARFLAGVDFNINGVDQFFLDDYLDSQPEGRPTTTLSSSDLAEWMMFWDENGSDYQIDILIEKLRNI